jgi:hypothetical protein
VIKFYDARTNGGIATQVVKPPCSAADECYGEERSAPTPPQIGTSARLGSGGNWQSATAKKKKKKRANRNKKRRGKKCKRAKRGKRCKVKRNGRKRSRNG